MRDGEVSFVPLSLLTGQGKQPHVVVTVPIDHGLLELFATGIKLGQFYVMIMWSYRSLLATVFLCVSCVALLSMRFNCDI